MIDVKIPGFGPVYLEHLVSDFTGTLSVSGKLLPGLAESLNEVATRMKIHVLTADTFGVARKELRGVKCTVHVLSGEGHDAQKERYVQGLGPEKVVTLGNGKNDRKMLRAAKVGIAVAEGEGCAVDAFSSADILVTRAADALNLLLDPRRLKATLRF